MPQLGFLRSETREQLERIAKDMNSDAWVNQALKGVVADSAKDSLVPAQDWPAALPLCESCGISAATAKNAKNGFCIGETYFPMFHRKAIAL